jgi:DNA-binding transcriptional LysR family regulator
VVSVDELESGGGLGSGDIDAAIAPAHPPEAGEHAIDLYREEGVLVVRRGHPRVRGKLGKKLFCELRHIDILLALGRGGIGHRVVTEFLASHGLTRDIAVSVPSFTAAATIAARTDWVAGMPRRLAELFVNQLPLVIASMPIPPLVFQMQLFWHERTHADPGARYFREVVTAAVASSARSDARKRPRPVRAPAHPPVISPHRPARRV